MRPSIHRSRPSRVVLFVAVMLVAASCRYSEVDGVGTRTADADHPPQLDVTLTGCTEGEFGQWTAEAVVTNPTDAAMTYEVIVAFQDGDVRLSQRSHWVRNLTPGETAAISPSWWIESPDRVTGCRVLTVNRFG